MLMNTEKSIIITAGNQPFFLRCALEIALGVRSRGGDPIVVDLSELCEINTFQYNEKLCKVFRISNPRFEFLDEIDRHGITHIKLAKTSIGESNLGYTISDQKILSNAITLLRDECPKSSALKHMTRKIVKEFDNTASSFDEFLRDCTNVVEVHLPNGRFPHQEAISEVADRFKLKKIYYERWFMPEQFYHSEIRTHNRMYFIEKFSEECFSRVSQGVVDATKWIEDRVIGRSSLEDFSWTWKSEKNIKHDELADVAESTRLKIVVFTSSEDEFAMLGDEWDSDYWVDQWTAITEVSDYLLNSGHEVTLRIHPNLANKNRRAFKRTQSHIDELILDRPSIKVISHDAQVNSYDLGLESDAVVVWNSTLGLEMECLGKPVYYLAPAIYSGATQAKPWKDQGPSPEVVFEVSSEPNLALQYLQFLIDKGDEFEKTSNREIGSELGSKKLALVIQWLSTEKRIISSLSRGASVLRNRSFRSSREVIFGKLLNRNSL